MERDSPTLAAWSQISGPFGRRCALLPFRSANRDGSSLPSTILAFQIIFNYRTADSSECSVQREHHGLVSSAIPDVASVLGLSVSGTTGIRPHLSSADRVSVLSESSSTSRKRSISAASASLGT